MANISEVIEEIAEYLGEYFLQESIDPDLFGVYSDVSAGYLYVKMDLKYPQSTSYITEHTIFSQKHIIARVSEEEILRIYEQESLNDFLYDYVEPNLPRIDGRPEPFSEKPYIILNDVEYYPDRLVELRTKIFRASTPNTTLVSIWPPPPMPLQRECGVTPYPFQKDSYFESRLKVGPDFGSLEDQVLRIHMSKNRTSGIKSNYYVNSKYQDQPLHADRLVAPFIFDEYNALNVEQEARIAAMIDIATMKP